MQKFIVHHLKNVFSTKKIIRKWYKKYLNNCNDPWNFFFPYTVSYVVVIVWFVSVCCNLHFSLMFLPRPNLEIFLLAGIGFGWRYHAGQHGFYTWRTPAATRRFFVKNTYLLSKFTANSPSRLQGAMPGCGCKSSAPRRHRRPWTFRRCHSVDGAFVRRRRRFYGASCHWCY